MKLPPSIEALVDRHYNGDLFSISVFTQEVAAEACRLQREDDFIAWGVDPDRTAVTDAPLVVEKFHV